MTAPPDDNTTAARIAGRSGDFFLFGLSPQAAGKLIAKLMAIDAMDFEVSAVAIWGFSKITVSMRIDKSI